MKEIPITPKALLDLNPIVIPDLARDLSSKSFWHYTNLLTVDLILDGCSFWVSPISTMNDLDELALHTPKKDKIHSLCFCNSETEKIPLWYLYSGISGKGAALGLTPGSMLAFLRSLKTVEGLNDDGKRDSLSIGSDIQLRIGWVYYQKQHETNHVFYKNKWYELDDVHSFQKDNYFIKNYPWEYEKEFRIIFINHTKNAYKRLIVPFSKELRDKIKIRLAPELTLSELSTVKNLKYISGAINSKLSESDLKIKMNLFSRNRTSLSAYLSEEFAKPNPEIDPNTICKLIQDASCCVKSKP